MKTILFLFILSLSFSSCMAQKGFDPKTTPVAKLDGDKIIMLVDEAIITNSLKSANHEIRQVKNIRLEKENEFSYLLFETETEKQTIPYAVRLIPQEPGSMFLLASGTTHSCDGNCCESCAFQKNTAGEITGCWCQRAAPTPGCQTEARCDHSVTSDSGGILE